MRSRRIAVLYIVVVTVSLVTLTMLVHVMDVNDKAWELASQHVKSNDAGIKSTIFDHYSRFHIANFK